MDYTSIILDIILCAVVVAAFIIGYKRGLLRSIWGLAAVIIAIILTIVIKPYTTDFFENSILHYMVEDHVYTAVTSYMDNAAEKGESTNSSVIFRTIYMLPDKYAEEASEIYDNTTEKTAAAASAAAADAVTSITEAILLFVAIRLALAIIYSILKLIFKFPILKQTNRLSGAIIQTALAFIAIYTILAIAAITGTDIFGGTVICKLLYNNNLLLNILGI